MPTKDANRVADDLRKAAAIRAIFNLETGKGINAVAGDHVGSETCAQTIARATR